MPAIIPAVATIAAGAMSARAAKKAGAQQTQSAEAGIEEQRRQFDLVQQLLQPYVSTGERGLVGYEALSGIAGHGAQQAQTDYLQNSPEFISLARQGENAILQNASATGGLRGGNVQGALADFRSNLLGGLIERQLGRFGSMAQMGQNSAARVGSAALTTGGQNAALMQQAGAARAGAGIAGANAITGAIGTLGGLFGGGFTPTAGPSSVLPGGGGGFGTGAQFGNQDFGAYF